MNYQLFKEMPEWRRMLIAIVTKKTCPDYQDKEKQEVLYHDLWK